MIRAGETGNSIFSSLYIFSSDGGVAMPGRTEMPDHAPVLVRDKDPDRESPLNVTQLRKAERVKDIFLWWIEVTPDCRSLATV